MAIKQFDKEHATSDGRRWIFYDYIYYPDGTRKKYMSKKYMTKYEAIQAEKDWLLVNQHPKENHDITFEELYILFREHNKDKVKVTTYYDYGNYWKHLKGLYKLKVKDFNSQDYEIWKKEMNKKNLATRTKNSTLKFLKSMINFADKWYDINIHSTYVKMENFTNPNEPKKEMDFYTYEEFKQFISAIDDLRFKTLFEVLYYCGLRRGEMLGLQWRDIDFNKKILSVIRNITWPKMSTNDQWNVTTPKTKTSSRTLPIPDVLYDDLIALKESFNKVYKFDKTWYIFGNVEPLRPNTLNFRKKMYCKKAGLREIRNHDFRHSCASLLINSGAPVTLVAKYLGHSKVDETLNTYSHFFQGDLDNIVSVINNKNKNI